MDILEASQLSGVDEKTHWWIRTRLFYVDWAVRRALKRFRKVSILEMGCGTSQNLAFLRQEFGAAGQINRLVGIEPALSSSRSNFPWLMPEDRVLRSLESLEAESGASARFDMLIAMDVLEHIEDDADALEKWVERLAPSATVFITVPAFPWLWSRHDKVLGHKRRYTRSTLTGLAVAAGLKPVKTGYIFGYILPLVYLVRKVLPKKMAGGDEQATDLTRTHPVPNFILTKFGWLESLVCGNPFFGTSVFGIFEKTGGNHG